jgi:hypothetical protein
MLKFCRHVSLVGAALAVLVLSAVQPAAAAYIAIDLHPRGFIESRAFGISGGQQVGFGIDGSGVPHALLWTGSAASLVDLHPRGFEFSEARGVSGGQQVGFGLDGGFHALLWTGSAASAVDLNAFLPPGFTEAEANGIDAEGNIVGLAFGPAGFHAFLWTVVPEPSTIVLFGIGLAGIVIAGWGRKKA